MNRLPVCVVVAAVAMLIAFPSAGAAQSGLQLRVASNPRPEMVSGGDVLLQVDLPAGVAPRDVRLTLNGADVTGALRADQPARALTGLVMGLGSGPNTLVATAGRATSRLMVVNHSIRGPVFAGPKEQPFVCQTQEFKLMVGGTLGPALDADCSVATRVDYVYRSTAGGDLKPLPDPKTPPDDLATATVLGRTVRYIVRIETGTINRGIYQIAMLHDPAREPAPDFATHPAGWNGRLIYSFGPGCNGGWFRQGASTGDIDDDGLLRQGYAVAGSSLNVYSNNCDDVLAAETMMMVREHFIEAYGVTKAIIGFGGSGGSYPQFQIGDNYPGLLDGLFTRRSFPDVGVAQSVSQGDARLLKHYFDRLATVPYTDEQKRQVAGYGVLATMTVLSDDAGRIHPTEFCPKVLPRELWYDAVKNPKGARCTVYDHAVNAYGRDPRTGFARRPVDNVGVQYGLTVLNSGVISTAQFLELNEKIGGFDHDATIGPARSVADPAALRQAYRTGRVMFGGGGLATTPIVDYRAYTDDLPEGNSHIRVHSFSMRERLRKANGHIDTHVMLTDDSKWGNSTEAPVLREGLRQLDAWITKLSEDTSGDSKIVKLRRAKPADLVDACWTRDGSPQKVAETAVPWSGRCEALYPATKLPRMVAGGPIANDLAKCQLKPMTAGDYKVPFTADEMTRLRQIFPAGVCDYSKPGVEQQPPAGVWQSFGAPPLGATAAR